MIFDNHVLLFPPPKKVRAQMFTTQTTSSGMFLLMFFSITTFVHPTPSEIPRASLEGMKRALVVHGCEGLDELSIAGPSKVAKRDGAHKR